MKAAHLFRALVFSTVVLASCGSASRTFANGHLFGQTVYAAPMETGWAVPTSYVYGTSYAWPTSYYLPTAYATTSWVPTYRVSPTAYIVPTTYYSATGYFSTRRSAFRPVYTTTSQSYYFPTTLYTPTVSYYAPTAFDYPMVAATDPCLQAPRVAQAVPSQPSPTYRQQGVKPPAARAPVTLDSEPANSGMAAPLENPPISSGVDSGAAADPDRKPTGTGGAAPPKRVQSLDGSDNDSGYTPLNAPADDKEKSPPTPMPAGKEAVKPAEAPPLPADAGREPAKQPPIDLPTLPNGPGETILRRRAQRPILSTPPKGFPNILSGTVKSRATNEREEGVRVTLSNRLQTFEDRVFETDAFGRFEARLPDGDWDLLVTMPSGNVLRARTLTMSNGQIVDELGRDIPSLLIKR